MKIELVWSDKMLFEAQAGDHRVPVDARPPIGANRGMMPKELLLSALGSCTAMDVAALLHKHKQNLERFRVEVEAPVSEGGHPKRFTRADVTFDVRGEVDADVLLKSVKASQTMYCGVTAMLSRAFPIAYKVVLNGALIGSGEASFDTTRA
ncbi:MAG: OsmC family protein [Deltaproteobacteria bacterium]|jgi:putative redox protein|nr:OsmC family protein [Deltaproteobacteria bacterium]